LAGDVSVDEPSAADREIDERRADEAIELARRLLLAGEASLTRRERRQRERLGRLIADPDGRAVLFALTDEVLRIDSPARAAHRFAAIVRGQRLAPFTAIDRWLLRAAAALAPRLPRLVMPLVSRRIVAETHGVVIPADEPAFSRYLERRRRAGVRLNVNPLGEAILSDAEAAARMRSVLERIARPDVDYVSLKISAVVAHLDPLAFDDSIARICGRLRTVYRCAMAAEPITFVNLDMEEYADLELSLVSFMRVLDEPEFEAIDAGIVLQAYVPDSHAALDRLGRWAVRRYDRAGGRIKVRIVKGANLAMESVDAELHGWVAAPYPTKADVDASYKKMLASALRPEWAGAVRVGVASHNLFDVAWALIAARAAQATERIDIEMLEGMAPAQARAVLDEVGDLLLYAPVVAADDIDASIAYLTRRLDENTQPDNFLRALFDLEADSREWRSQAERFRDAVRDRFEVATERRRRPLPRRERFSNEPDTDTTDPEVRVALADASSPPATFARVTTVDRLDELVATAADAFAGWSGRSSDDRRALVRRAADEMRRRRFDTIAVMADETGKTFHEADPEVSEAIDFAEYYAGPGSDLLDGLCADGLEVRARGVVAVIGPWNFPYAIPAGGVFAALCAGNVVVLKPAPEAVRVAATLVDQLHRSGIPDDVVQLVVCEDGPVGRHLVTHVDVDTVVLTGSAATADLFLSWDPRLRLFAETSGKNAMVITAAADLDLAIADLVRSAFGHAGQKCSAASLAIVEAEVYDDPTFLRRLRDAVVSWRVGWPSELATMIGPVIAPPSGPLERALTRLDPGESWLVHPHALDGSGRLWRPGVRIGVRPGSWFHRTECFGPVLGVMRADDLDHAIEIQNAVAYGLTGGLHSLDEAEIARWLDRVHVGNAYVNRGTTGAVVQRQPFGGWKRSIVGPGTKAGGPSYLLQFCRIGDDPDRPIGEVADSYRRAWDEFFTVPHDPSGLRAESNVLRHLPVERVVVRHDGSRPGDLERLEVAARTTGVELVVVGPGTPADEFVAALRPNDRVRLVGPVEPELLARLHDAHVWIEVESPSPHGRVELLRWVREQAIARTLHRHGRLPESR
jgi:RHH-type proline utilization regulon transcriptional repressor/proline dehydrogenase/delta 1-pyrroline-5-carboxylate dehydrogenase